MLPCPTTTIVAPCSTSATSSLTTSSVAEILKTVAKDTSWRSSVSKLARVWKDLSLEAAELPETAEGLVFYL